MVNAGLEGCCLEIVGGSDTFQVCWYILPNAEGATTGKDGYRTPLVSLNRDRSLFITGECRHFFLLLSISFTIDPLVTMPVVAATLLLRVELNQRVDTHNGNARLDGRLQLLDLAHAGLEDTGLQAVVHLAVCQVQTVVLVVLRLGELLGVLRGGVCGVDCSLRKCVS